MKEEVIIEAAREFEKSTGFGDIILRARGVNSAAGIGFLEGAVWMQEQMNKKHLWKDAQGDDLPAIDRDVIALQGRKVVFAHRPNPDGWDGINITTGKVTHYTPITYDKGGWNTPDVKYWLDAPLPDVENMEE